jgi:hypothetical protein
MERHTMFMDEENANIRQIKVKLLEPHFMSTLSKLMCRVNVLQNHDNFYYQKYAIKVHPHN